MIFKEVTHQTLLDIRTRFTSELVYRGNQLFESSAKKSHMDEVRRRLGLIEVNEQNISDFIKTEGNILDIGYFELNRQKNWAFTPASNIIDIIKIDNLYINLLTISETLLVLPQLKNDFYPYSNYLPEEKDRRKELYLKCNERIKTRLEELSFTMPQIRAYCQNEMWLNLEHEGNISKYEYFMSPWTEKSTDLNLFDACWGRWGPSVGK